MVQTLDLHDVVRGYNSLQQESKELDAFLSKAASGTTSNEINNGEPTNNEDADIMLIIE